MIVFTAAIMDFLHEGHLNLLETMRRRAGELGRVVVVLHDDASCWRIKGKVPVQSVVQRKRNVEITGYADEVLVTELTDPADQWLRLVDRYEVDNLYFIRGDDNLEPPGKWMLDHFGIYQEYIPYTRGVSSTELRASHV